MTSLRVASLCAAAALGLWISAIQVRAAAPIGLATACAELGMQVAGERGDADGRAGGQDAVLTHMWFVTFDRSVDAEDLPFDVIQLAAEARQRGNMGPVGQRENGRIITTGVARQLKQSELRVKSGGCTLAFKDGRLVTDGETGKKQAPWTVFAAPAVVSLVGQAASVGVGQKLPYMVKNADGSLRVVESTEMNEGASIELTVERAGEKEVRFGRINLKVSRVTSRQPIDGVPFEVGVPIVDSRETSLSLTIEPGKVALIPLPQGDDEQPITVFLTATHVRQ